jgi:hypothetical protein
MLELLGPCRKLSCLRLKMALSAWVSSPVEVTPLLGNIRVLFEFFGLAHIIQGRCPVPIIQQC